MNRIWLWAKKKGLLKCVWASLARKNNKNRKQKFCLNENLTGKINWFKNNVFLIQIWLVFLIEKKTYWIQFFLNFLLFSQELFQIFGPNHTKHTEPISHIGTVAEGFLFCLFSFWQYPPITVGNGYCQNALKNNRYQRWPGNCLIF